jgi:hypothetical protein
MLVSFGPFDVSSRRKDSGMCPYHIKNKTVGHRYMFDAQRPQIREEGELTRRCFLSVGRC